DELKVLDRGNVVIDIENLTRNFDDIEKIEQLRAKTVEKERRTFDYGPFIREFISILHERGELKELLAAADYMGEGDE
ncbi:5297_t:CDS:2, partial [Acaulospora colombiana]